MLRFFRKASLWRIWSENLPEEDGKHAKEKLAAAISSGKLNSEIIRRLHSAKVQPSKVCFAARKTTLDFGGGLNTYRVLS